MNALARLPWPLAILWCYALWWGTMVGCHFEPGLRLWATSLGIAGIVGCALVLSTWPAGETLRLGHPRLATWGTARLFIMPFAVSSFAATVKGQGFILVFSPVASEDLIALGLCAALLAATATAKRANTRRGTHPAPRGAPA